MKPKANIEEVPLKSEAEAMKGRAERISHLVAVTPPTTATEMNKLSDVKYIQHNELPNLTEVAINMFNCRKIKN